MKTTKLIIIATILLVSNLSLSAKTGGAIQKGNLDEVIKSSVSYPDYARNAGITGFVLVELKTTKDGAVNVNQVNSDNEILKNYVVNQLGHIRVSCPKICSEETHIYKFSFKLK